MTGDYDELTDDGLTAAIERVIRDFVYLDGGVQEAAREIVRQLPALLRQDGWMPPGDLRDQVRDWALRTGKIPEHHVNRDVLTSHLSELADILNA